MASGLRQGYGGTGRRLCFTKPFDQSSFCSFGASTNELKLICSARLRACEACTVRGSERLKKFISQRRREKLKEKA